MYPCVSTVFAQGWWLSKLFWDCLSTCDMDKLRQRQVWQVCDGRWGVSSGKGCLRTCWCDIIGSKSAVQQTPSDVEKANKEITVYRQTIKHVCFYKPPVRIKKLPLWNRHTRLQLFCYFNWVQLYSMIVILLTNTFIQWYSRVYDFQYFWGVEYLEASESHTRCALTAGW